ncbi:hypothetical protein SNE40_015262 [Patella caerulea]|uniref:Large ribosomal subunit protein mL42 n=1 Tax=Patella caerulea TaxID=87958 RepID=A0AAN8PRT6_PATCE
MYCKIPTFTYRSTQSCLSPDGSCILFWHPEQNFPYEHTQPIPRKVKELEEADTVLKVQLLKEEEIKHRPDGPTDAELSNIFYETKHRWFPRPEKKYRKVNPPKDRDGL